MQQINKLKMQEEDDKQHPWRVFSRGFRRFSIRKSGLIEKEGDVEFKKVSVTGFTTVWKNALDLKPCVVFVDTVNRECCDWMSRYLRMFFLIDIHFTTEEPEKADCIVTTEERKSKYENSNAPVVIHSNLTPNEDGYMEFAQDLLPLLYAALIEQRA
jgi:hypothetical protein